MDYIQALENLLELWGYVPERSQFLYKEIGKVDLMLTDIEHEIENDNFSSCEGYRKAKRLKELRQLRRKLKNEHTLLEELTRYINGNSKVKIDLYKIKSSMEKIKQQQEFWVYVPRVPETEAQND